MGRAACEAASSSPPTEGSVGAGTGATVGKLYGMAGACKGGIGSAGLALPDGVSVAALVAVNAFGDVIDPRSGDVIAGARDPRTGAFADTCERMKAGTHRPGFGAAATNTVIGVVATDARLTKIQTQRVAIMAHDGLGRAIAPAHTVFDGDVVFAVSAGQRPGDPTTIGLAAAEVLAEAILRAVRMAEPLHGVPNGREIADTRTSGQRSPRDRGDDSRPPPDS